MKAHQTLNALRSPYAKGVLHQIEMHGSLTVSDIVHRTLIDQSVVSQCLAKFRRIGLVNVERSGKWMRKMCRPVSWGMLRTAENPSL